MKDRARRGERARLEWQGVDEEGSVVRDDFGSKRLGIVVSGGKGVGGMGMIDAGRW